MTPPLCNWSHYVAWQGLRNLRELVNSASQSDQTIGQGEFSSTTRINNEKVSQVHNTLYSTVRHWLAIKGFSQLLANVSREVKRLCSRHGLMPLEYFLFRAHISTSGMSTSAPYGHFYSYLIQFAGWVCSYVFAISVLRTSEVDRYASSRGTSTATLCALQ